jgi:RNA polymerase sigma-70 factor (ECF subfamily)
VAPVLLAWARVRFSVAFLLRYAPNLAMERMCDEAARQWPGVKLDASGFRSWLGARAVKLSGLHAVDLYLAAGCTAGDGKALEHFERAFISQLKVYTSRMSLSRSELDELAAKLREQLLVGPKPGIAEYSGSGPLGAWVRVAAIRAALKLRRGTKPSTSNEEEAAVGPLVAPGADPELDALKREHRTELSGALTAVLEGLTRDERRVLKLHFLDGLSIDEIGVLYKVHRSTIARWIASARAAVLKKTRARLADRLELSNTECDSLIDVMRSRLDVSFRRVLETRQRQSRT